MVLSSTVILASTLLGRQGPQACTSSPCSPSLPRREGAGSREDPVQVLPGAWSPSLWPQSWTPGLILTNNGDETHKQALV